MQTRYPKVLIKCLGDEKLLPRYSSELASGADLLANIEVAQVLKKGQRILISTGICLEIPIGYEAQIRSRSGLSLNYGVVCLNSPGTIDADYRGEIQVILANFSEQDFIIKPLMRIAQLVIAPVVQAEFHIQNTLTNSGRGERGFGSTGL